MRGRVIGALLVFGLCCQLASAAKILAVFSHISYAPYLLVAPYMKALVQRGHELTIISARKYLAEIDGARHIRVDALDRLNDDFRELEAQMELPLAKWDEAVYVADYFQKTSTRVLSDSGVQSLLQNKSSHFDLVILDASFTDALYGFARHYNAPLVGLSMTGSPWNINYLAGNRAPSIYEPIISSGYSHGFSLLDKLRNLIYITEEWLLEQLVYLPAQLALYKRVFNQTAESLYAMRRGFALILINQHFSLGRARSNVPNVIEVAGMHLEQPMDALDAQLKQFVDGAEHGVIVFSMGIEIISTWMPPNLMPTVLEIFAQLPQRIILKYDMELSDISGNIYMTKMMPQRALLCHPRVKLFITHGGILSIIEGAYYAVPMLCLPMYYDQFGNCQLMKLSGVAQVLDVTSLTVESVGKAIDELITNPLYALNAQNISRRLRDQPMSPLETAVWWTEYVLRHKGAAHMRISEEDVSFIQYYNIDFIFVLFLRFGGAVLIVAAVSFKLVIFLLRRSHFRLTVPFLH